MDVILGPYGKLTCDEDGSYKRTGGVGDILSGVIAQFLNLCEDKTITLDTCAAACFCVRKASNEAYRENLWGFAAPHVLEKLGGVVNQTLPL